MTGTPPDGSSATDAPARVQTRITVDDPQLMVRLLGSHDEILKLVERTVRSDVHVRGNEITISGAPADNAKAEQIFAELLELVRKGETLTPDAVRRTVGMLEQGGSERPAEVLTLNILSRRGRTIRRSASLRLSIKDALVTDVGARWNGVSGVERERRSSSTMLVERLLPIPAPPTSTMYWLG